MKKKYSTAMLLPASRTSQAAMPSDDNQEIQFSVITSERGSLTKRMSLQDGELVKDSSGCRLSEGKVKKILTTPERFAKKLRGLNKSKALIHGVCGYDEAFVVPKSQLAVMQQKGKGRGDCLPIISRTKKNFHYPDAPGILMLDYDSPRDNSTALHNKALESFTPAKLIECIGNILPEISGCVWVSTPSTSACIYDSETGEELRGVGSGFHLYIFPELASDTPRFLDVLGKRLWLAGFGRIEISRSGACLVRTVVDLAVGSPERLDFVAGAVCGKGIEQRLPDPQYSPGQLLATDMLEDLSPEEDEKYKELIANTIAKASATQEQIRREYITEETEKLIQKTGGKLDSAQAREIIESRQQYELAELDILFFAHQHEGMAVQDVLDNGQEYDGQSLADPLEPDYDGGSKTKARFYWNKGNPAIHSYAHGSVKYTFSRFTEKEIDFEEAIPELLKRCMADCGAPFELENLEMLARLKKQDKSLFMRVRNDIKRANKDIIISELDSDISSRATKKLREVSSPSTSSSLNFLT